MDIRVVSSFFVLYNKIAMYVFVQVFKFLFGKCLRVKILDQCLINLIKLTNTYTISFVPNLPQ